MSPPANPTDQQNHDDLAKALSELTKNLELLRESVAALRADITPMLDLYKAGGMGVRFATWLVTTFAAIGAIWVVIYGEPRP